MNKKTVKTASINPCELLKNCENCLRKWNYSRKGDRNCLKSGGKCLKSDGNCLKNL